MKMPDWNIPDNLTALLAADDDGIWEDPSWEPILLTVMTGTVYRGRDIPHSWQLEFEPVGPDFELSNRKISAMGIEPDGYGWARLVLGISEKYQPEIVDELQFGDTEESTCVVWVESEETCRKLIQLVWFAIHGYYRTAEPDV